MSYDESFVWSADLFYDQRVQTNLSGRGIRFCMSGGKSRKQCSSATGYKAGMSLPPVYFNDIVDLG